MKGAMGMLLFASILPACSGNGDSRSGTGEPLVVKVKSASKATLLAQFIPGKLPAAGTGTGGGSSLGVDASVPMTLQAIITSYSEPFVYQGQGNVPVSGIASNDVAAVAFALEGLSTGYWVVPVGPLDGNTLQPTWDIIADFSPSVPEGFRYLQFAGIDGNGHVGTLQSQKICVASRVPDGYQGCVPSPKPPAAIISLSWDTNVDLDLQVKTPDGRLVEPKNPLTVDLDAGSTTIPPDVGRIDRDSNGNCVIDNIRYENLVWTTSAPTGRYGIYVNLFDSCKQPVVHFNVQVYTTVDVPTEDAGTTKQLHSWYSANGILLDFQANGGSNIGFFVSEFDF
jgi:hypothetical protein